MQVDAGHLRALERLGGGRTLYEVIGGPHAGAQVVGPDDPRAPSYAFWQMSRAEQREAERRAEELLDSLLDDRQREQRRALRGAFWVDGPLGWLRLGRLYDLRLRPAHRPEWEQAMCVVPLGWDERRPPTPTADLWVNVLLMALHAPDEFRRVAIVHRDTRRLTASGRPCDRCGSPFAARPGGWACRACVRQPATAGAAARRSTR